MTKQFTQFDEVEYNDNPFHFNFLNVSDSVAKTILRKSSDWKYEQEIRFIVERNKSVGFVKDSLVEINFGSKCKNRDVMNIQYLISKLGSPNCKFFNSDIDTNNFQVKFKECDIDLLRKEVLEESKIIRYSKIIDLKHLL